LSNAVFFDICIPCIFNRGRATAYGNHIGDDSKHLERVSLAAEPAKLAALGVWWSPGRCRQLPHPVSVPSLAFKCDQLNVLQSTLLCTRRPPLLLQFNLVS